MTFPPLSAPYSASAGSRGSKPGRETGRRTARREKRGRRWNLGGLLASDAASGGSGSGLLGEVAGDADAAVLGEGDVELAVVPVAREDEEGVGQNGHGEHVEDAEEDEAAGDGDLVAAVAETEGDGVQQPEQVLPAGEQQVVALDADAAGAGGALSQGASGQQDPGDGAKGIEAPLVVGGGEGRHEVGDDPSPRQEDVEDDGGPRDARQQAQRQDDGGERHDPVDVLAVEDLAGGTVVGDVGLADDQEAEIRGLGEVGDGADQEGDGVQVVEDLLAGAGDEGEAEEDNLRRGGMILAWCVWVVGKTYQGKPYEGERVDGGHGPEPVGTVLGEELVTRRGVDVEGIVCASDETHLECLYSCVK